MFCLFRVRFSDPSTCGSQRVLSLRAYMLLCGAMWFTENQITVSVIPTPVSSEAGDGLECSGYCLSAVPLQRNSDVTPSRIGGELASWLDPLD